MKSFAPVCVDASLVIRLFVPQAESEPKVPALWRRWESEGRRTIAPALILYEVTNALHQYSRHGLITASEADEILIALDAMGVELFENASLHRQALVIAREFGLRATYDAHYLALAQQMHAEFWTTDARLVKAVGEAMPWVHLATIASSGDSLLSR